MIGACCVTCEAAPVMQRSSRHAVERTSRNAFLRECIVP